MTPNLLDRFSAIAIEASQGGTTLRLASMSGWLERQVHEPNNPATGFVMLFVGGVLASLLPCVYPLYPITASIVRGRGAGSPVWLHPLAYYLGVASIYFIFGVIASVSGGAFNHVMRFGMTNVAIASVFALLGLTTMDYLHLPFFRPRNLPVGGGLPGTFLMGLTLVFCPRPASGRWWSAC